MTLASIQKRREGMILICGASGKTGSQIARLLQDSGKQIRCMGRSASKLSAFSERGAQIAEGDQGNENFFLDALDDVESMYLLIPPKPDAIELGAYYHEMGESAGNAIADSDVQRVVFLSSLGAEHPEGTGPVAGLHEVEEVLRGMPGIDLTIIRAGYFMENFMSAIPLIKKQGLHGDSIDPNAPISMIATKDIASKAAELLAANSFTGENIMDYFGDRLSQAKITRILGEMIGDPNLRYTRYSAEDAIAAFQGMGMSQSVARGYVELSDAISRGDLHATTVNPESPNAPTSFTGFVQETWFPAYQQFSGD